MPASMGALGCSLTSAEVEGINPYLTVEFRR